MHKSKLFRMNLLCLLMLDMLDNHVKSQLLINQISCSTLKSHAFVKIVLLILAHSAVDIINEFIVDFILLG